MMEKKVFYNIVFRMDFISGWEYKFKIGLVIVYKIFLCSVLNILFILS